ncbi:hypothetical protein ACJ73_08958 [Blastomyces percursus]|uniref:F-box domain-containing protein n=1 Tax=Blastomyces percursus TaxID=1658174 RepID=A0A1J9PH09_9EURO|nr:hypothetical protein ACJ73_08958 [Blastomyces percursus]
MIATLRHFLRGSSEVPPSTPTLPPEVMIMVLEHMPDLFTLFLIVRTCRHFYALFQDNESRIMASVYKNEWGDALGFDYSRLLEQSATPPDHKPPPSTTQNYNCLKLFRQLVFVVDTTVVTTETALVVFKFVWHTFRLRNLEEDIWQGNSPFGRSGPLPSTLFPLGNVLTALGTISSHSGIASPEDVRGLRLPYAAQSAIRVERQNISYFEWPEVPGRDQEWELRGVSFDRPASCKFFHRPKCFCKNAILDRWFPSSG